MFVVIFVHFHSFCVILIFIFGCNYIHFSLINFYLRFVFVQLDKFGLACVRLCVGAKLKVQMRY